MFSYSTVALHIHFVAWCWWFMKLLHRYHHMLLLILGSQAFHILVIVVCFGRKWYTLLVDGQAHSGWRMWFMSLSQYPDCHELFIHSEIEDCHLALCCFSFRSMKTSVTHPPSKWDHGLWFCLSLPLLKIDSGQLHTHDTLIIVQYSCNTLCTDLSLLQPWIKCVKLNGEIHSGTACTFSRCATLLAVVGASLGHGTSSCQALMPFTHCWTIWVFECEPLSLPFYDTCMTFFFSNKT